MPDRRAGLSTLELILVVAVVGILLAVAAVVFPQERQIVNQAVQTFARTVEKARFDAIQLNNFVVVGIHESGYCVLAVAERSVPFDRDEDIAVLPASAGDLSCAGGTGITVVANVDFGAGSGSGLTIRLGDNQGDVESGLTSLTLLIDPRGLGQTIDWTGGTITGNDFVVRIEHVRGFSRDILVNVYGRTAEI